MSVVPFTQETVLSQDQVDLVRRTVARGSSDDELSMFLALAKKFELDAFAKEIYLICPLDDRGERKMKNGQPEAAIIMASRDGFLAIANRHPAYSGMVSDVVYEHDEFSMVRARGENDVEHTYGSTERGKIVGAYAIVYRSDRSVPSFFWASWAQYGEPNARDRAGKIRHWSPWSKYPHAMLVKVAEAAALKKAFSISGIVSEAEMDAGQAIEDGANGVLTDRAPLSTPRVSPASRGIGRAHTAPATPTETMAARAEAELPADPDPVAEELEHDPDDDIPFGEDMPPLPPLDAE